jgi:hypothetical protein
MRKQVIALQDLNCHLNINWTIFFMFLWMHTNFSPLDFNWKLPPISSVKWFAYLLLLFRTHMGLSFLRKLLAVPFSPLCRMLCAFLLFFIHQQQKEFFLCVINVRKFVYSGFEPPSLVCKRNLMSIKLNVVQF